ncbi:MAG: MoxR family ATPase [Lachnospiraceae bacterium]|nr:MoxR family ATPase [Lachnospiraceae bacterium]
MNIKQAKDYIKNTVSLYLKRDEYGEYRIPVVRQRPIFLLGAPGIGKTAIMEQIAQELGIALVSYSMTHHTRQSALGLPFITTKKYGDEEYSVSEYTMSEIIASVYETMERSGVREGILFLDEINCVSETLAPSMLQFLQYKVFGRHQVPDGWVIVTAGNPPEYNRSVREFDVVTMDRLKLLEVEPDYGVWREYARERQLHGAVLGYLDLKKDHFYVMEMTSKGRNYVTARGWEDLSEILKLYEEDELAVSAELIGQYLRGDEVVKEFAAYYDLYNKYKKDYRIAEILQGQASPQAISRAKAAKFDERISLLGLLYDRVETDMRGVMDRVDVLTQLQQLLKPLENVTDMSGTLTRLIETRSKRLHSMREANALSPAEKKREKAVLAFLEEGKKAITIAGCEGTGECYHVLKDQYARSLQNLRRETEGVSASLSALFAFCEEAFEGGNEMLILVTELTVGTASARFLAHFGSPEYQKHKEELMLTERSDALQEEIRKLDL